MSTIGKCILVVAQAWEGMGEDRRMVAKRHRLSLCGDEHVPRLTVVMVAVSVDILKDTKLYTLNRCIVWKVNYSSIKLLFFLKTKRRQVRE